MSIAPHHPRKAVDDLFTTLDPLAYPARMRALATWTRNQVADRDGAGDIRPLLDELDTRGPFGRRLAVVAAVIAGDTGFLEARLADPDATVRGHALKSTLHLPISDAALERAMDDAPEAVRRQIATVVVAGGRTDLAERLIVPVREQWGDAEAARLLPGCGAEAVERLLPGLFLAVARWRALGRRYPDLVLDEAARQLADLPETARTDWWRRNADIFPAAVEARPLRVLELLERHCPAHLPGPVSDCLGHLLKAAPGRTIGLITAPAPLVPDTRGLVSRTALSRLARQAPPELVDLGRALSHTPEFLAQVLRALPPCRREGFYDAVTAGQDLIHSTLSSSLLDALPRRRAQTEARRMATQAAERGASWDTVLSAVSYVPVAEARPRLIAATRRPAAEDRALAYPLLIRNAARSGEAAAIATLLDDLQRLRNEQEPVRSPALTALSEVPPGLFAGVDTALLDRIATDAVEARDSSWRTRQALSKLALAMLREHAVSGERPLVGWALATLTQLSGHTGGANLGRLDTTLRRGQEFQVFEALRPWLEAGADKVDHSLTFALARALGRRARHMPELQELLWQAVQFGNDSTVIRAVDLWLDDPATRDERAVRVLEPEPSAAVLHPVLRVLTRRRTDWLDVLLADRPPYGRFVTPGTRWIPPIDGIRAWLPRQQAAVARLLARAAGDVSLPRQARAGYIRSAAGIPELGFQVVAGHLDSPDTVLAEAALGALAWTDRPAEALPLLLAHVADERARVAIYAATRVTAFVAPSQLETVLRAALLPGQDGTPAPAAKVTSRKELIRLAASRLPVGSAGAILAEAFALPGQHPDVRAACVPVAAELLRSPAAWSLLEGAAGGPPVTQAAVLRIQPYELQPGDRARYARLVGEVSGSSDAETADTATGLLARWSPWYPEAVPLLLARTVDLDNRSSWRAAADGLVALTASADGAGPLLEALAELVTAEAESPAHHLDAEADRDRPARQRTSHLVARLSSSVLVRQAKTSRAAALRASELLIANDDFRSLGTHLAAVALDFDARPVEVLDALDHLAALHADRPALAIRTAETLRHRLTTARRPGDPLVLLSAVDRLTANARYADGLLAVAITQALGPRTGWPQEWRTQLRALRRHAHPDVRDAALALTTAVE
ncbi:MULTISPECIES: hypothetical protein [unclassified Streptomyces]|uniref:hypothetical protein n=1 Tax=unclassified Streptomyces TaxID=2593676 RepID=UPI000B84B53D|nr:MULTISPECIES: hypothetical protein [unclassified Streptomyces]MYS22482.1 hypothetical protein [Streptomyces sp. SID4948]